MIYKSLPTFSPLRKIFHIKNPIHIRKVMILLVYLHSNVTHQNIIRYWVVQPPSFGGETENVRRKSVIYKSLLTFSPPRKIFHIKNPIHIQQVMTLHCYSHYCSNMLKYQKMIPYCWRFIIQVFGCFIFELNNLKISQNKLKGKNERCYSTVSMVLSYCFTAQHLQGFFIC